MKSRLFPLFLMLHAISFCKAQDSIVTLNASMFDEYLQTISLTSLDAWVFKPGNDTSWSKIGIDTRGWTKLNPSLITAKMADKAGKLEGWIRMRFQLDSSFENMAV